MEAEDYACQPRPVHHRIPNFVDADRAAARLGRLPEFEAAAMVKVNPNPNPNPDPNPNPNPNPSPNPNPNQVRHRLLSGAYEHLPGEGLRVRVKATAVS